MGPQPARDPERAGDIRARILALGFKVRSFSERAGLFHWGKGRSLSGCPMRRGLVFAAARTSGIYVGYHRSLCREGPRRRIHRRRCEDPPLLPQNPEGRVFLDSGARHDAGERLAVLSRFRNRPA